MGEQRNTSNSDSPLHRFMSMKKQNMEATTARYSEDSRKRLDKIISTKMNTTMIGSLATFEKNFGFLWGQGKKDSERTEEERECYTLWQNVRTEVLNNGNNQIRALRNELQNHDVNWKRYQLTIKAKPAEESQENE